MGSIGAKAMNEVAEVLCGIRDVTLMRRFMEGILTPGELEEIGRRWELVKLLERGVSQRQIAKKLGMSLCKITRGSRELKKNNSAMKKVLDEYLG
jgi:TrpR family trp operon transcriptional repressor